MSTPSITMSKREMKKSYKLLVRSLLTDAEKEFMYRCAKKYQRTRHLEIFIQELSQIINTVGKLRLLPYIRTVVYEFDKHDFDKFAIRQELKMKEGRTEFRMTQPRNTYTMAPSVRSSVPNGRTDLRVIVIPHREDNLGFSIRGGSEHGLGIFVSEVDAGSSAAESGLEVGDQILEANNISLENVACSSAVRVLTVTDRLKLVVKRVGKIPEWKLAKEKVLWYDVPSGEIVAAPPVDSETYHISGLDRHVIREKRVAVKTTTTTDFIGLNIRGGSEYGLGIYISRVDPGGLAEKNGICTGDQVINVNGTDFSNITHSAAADFLRTNNHLVFTLREVGRYPAFKELFAEYTWSETANRKTGKVSVPDSPISSPPLHRQTHNPVQASSRTRSKSIGSLSQNSGGGLVSEIYLPKASQSQEELSKIYQEEEEDIEEEDDEFIMDFYDLTGKARKVKVDVIKDPEFTDANFVCLNGSDKQSDNDSAKLKQNKERRVFPATSKAVLENRLKKNYEYETRESQIKPDIYQEIEFNQNGTKTNDHKNHANPKLINFDEYIIPKERPPHSPVDPLYAEMIVERTNHIDGNISPTRKTSPHFDGNSSPTRKMSPNIEDTAYHHIETMGSPNGPRSPHLIGSRSPSLQHQVNGYDELDDGTVIVTEVEEDSQPRPVEEEPLYSQVNKVKLTDKIENAVNGGQGHKGEMTDGSMTPEEEEVLQNLDDQIKMLEDRKSHLSSRAVIQINPDENKEKKGTWSKIKSRLKGSMRLKKKRAPLTTPDVSGQPSPLPGMSPQGSFDHDKMAVLEERAREKLNDQEYTQAIDIIKQYHGDKDLETMVNSLVKMLDSPDKMLLLRDVRGVLYPYHVGRFDNMMTYYEMEKYDDMSTKLHLPLRHSEKLEIKPKPNLMTTILDENGHFHIRTVDQHARDVEVEQKVLNTLRSQASQDSAFPPGPVRASPGPAPVKAPRQTPVWGKKALGPPITTPPPPPPPNTGPSLHNHAPKITLVEREPMVATARLEPIMATNTPPPSDPPEKPTNTSQIQWVKLNHVEPQAQRNTIRQIFNNKDDIPEPNTAFVFIAKQKPQLGLTLRGGRVGKVTLPIRIDEISPEGTTADSTELRPGMVLLGVDGKKLAGLSTEEAQDLLEQCYDNKTENTIKLQIKL